MAAERVRLDDQPAYVLHSYPFRETSLVVEAFTRLHGRVALVARGARRPKSALRGLLRPFQPLRLAWYGKSELRTLHAAEWDKPARPLAGQALVCGFYLNELLLRLLAREDAHEELYLAYENALERLADSDDHAPVLRAFELAMLRAQGYAPALDRCADGGPPVEPENLYGYRFEHGPVSVAEGQAGVQLRGKTLLDMMAGDYRDPLTRSQSKSLMRVIINHYLGDQPLHTRQMMKDLQEL